MLTKEELQRIKDTWRAMTGTQAERWCADLLNDIHGLLLHISQQKEHIEPLERAIKVGDDIVTMYGVLTCARAREMWEEVWPPVKVALEKKRSDGEGVS